MSNVLNRLHDADRPAPPPPPSQWYLRTDDGSIYGPVTMDVMRDWVTQSRVGPGNDVSPDGENWVLAESVPDLKMEWMAALPDGRTYGPFNVLAVPSLYENGSISADATLLHPGSGKTVKVADLLRSQGVVQAEDSKPLENAKIEKWKQLYQEEKKARLDNEAALQQEIDLLQQQTSALEEELTRARDTVDRETQELTLLEIDSHSKTKRLAEKAARLEKEVAEMAGSLEAIEQLRSENHEYKERVMSFESDADSMKKELEGTNKQLTQLNEHYEALKAEARKQLEDLDSQNEAFTAEKQQIREANLQLEDDKVRLVRLTEQLKTALTESDSQSKTLQKQLSQASTELLDLKKQSGITSDSLKIRIAELEKKLDIAGDQLERTSGNLTDRTAEIESERSQARSAQERLAREIQALQQSLRSQKESHDAELARETLKNEELQRKLEQAKDDVKADSSLLSQTRERIAQLEHELETKETAFTADNQRLQTELSDSVRSCSGMAAKIADLEEQLTKDSSGLNQTISELRTTLQNTTEEKKRLAETTASEIAALKKTVEDQNQNAAASRKSLDARERELAEATGTLSKSDRTAADLKEKLQAALDKIRALEETNQSLDVSFNAQKKSMNSREQNLSDEVRLLKARIAELDSEAVARSTEKEALQQHIEQLETQTRELSTQLSSRTADLEETRKKMQQETEGLQKSAIEKDASAARLSDEVNSLQQQLHDTASLLKKARADYTQLQEDASQREKELREQAAGSSDQLTKAAESSARQINELEKTAESLRTQLEAAVAEGKGLSGRLDNALSRILESERAAARERKSLESHVIHLDAQLEKKSSSLEQITADFNKIKSESTATEHSLRSTVRMLEKREIAGKKHLKKLESYVEELETARRDLGRKNSTLVEEVKDAMAQLANLTKQVAPLTRKIQVQEELIKRRLAGQVDSPSPTPAAVKLSLTVQAIRLRVGKLIALLASGSATKRRAVLVTSIVLLLVALFTVKNLFPGRPAAAVDPQAAVKELEKQIAGYIAEKPDLSLAATPVPVGTGLGAKVHAWTGLNLDKNWTEVSYGDHECTVTFLRDIFTTGAALTDEGTAAVKSMAADQGAVLGNFQIIISGLSEANAQETGGSEMADYSLRLQRADAVRTILTSDRRIKPTQVTIAAGETSDPASRSVIIRLRPAE